MRKAGLIPWRSGKSGSGPPAAAVAAELAALLRLYSQLPMEVGWAAAACEHEQSAARALLAHAFHLALRAPPASPLAAAADAVLGEAPPPLLLQVCFCCPPEVTHV